MKGGSELPARRGAKSLLSLLRMKMRTSQKGLPRNIHFKGGESLAPSKDPHLWLQVQGFPQPTMQGEKATRKLMITSTGIVSEAELNCWGESKWAGTEQRVNNLPSNLDATKISSPQSLLSQLRVDLGPLARGMKTMA
eukprot:2713763-Heterocapsa_arctica.AAC.1